MEQVRAEDDLIVDHPVLDPLQILRIRLRRSEAERLLDALRAGEKNLQVWRFAKDKRKEARRSDAEKDW